MIKTLLLGTGHALECLFCAQLLRKRNEGRRDELIAIGDGKRGRSAPEEGRAQEVGAKDETGRRRAVHKIASTGFMQQVSEGQYFGD